MYIGFIGLGKLGMPCAEAMAQKYDVTGYDIQPKTSNLVDIVSNLEQAVTNKDLVFVAIQTPHQQEYDGSQPCMDLEPKDFDYSQVKQCLQEINKYANKHTLVVLISTVLPGTVRRELAPLITQARFIYNPYLIAMGSVSWDMINPEMVIVGTKNGSYTDDATLIIDFYKELMENNPRYVVGTWEEAESIKIFYNTFISAKLSLVNMIQDVSMKLGNMNVDVVTDALSRSTQRIMGPQYMKAGMGDGGPCHPRDNIALRFMVQELGLGYDLFDAIMQAREIQAENVAFKLVDLANEYNMQIVIHGKAYKPQVPYLEGSYSLLIGHYCKKLGFDPVYVDPETGDAFEPTEPCVFLLAHSANTTYKYTNNQPVDTNTMYCLVPDGSVVVDMWRGEGLTCLQVAPGDI